MRPLALPHSYGSRIYKLKGASPAAVLEEKNAFTVHWTTAPRRRPPPSKPTPLNTVAHC